MRRQHWRAPERHACTGPHDSSLGRTPLVRMLPALFGAFVVLAIVAINTGALATTASKLFLGLVIAGFFLTSFYVIDRGDHRDQTVAFVSGPPPADGAFVVENCPPLTSEVDEVESWRHTRLVQLRVPDETATILATQREFSVHELEGLLSSGCPLDTALRILNPV